MATATKLRHATRRRTRSELDAETVVRSLELAEPSLDSELCSVERPLRRFSAQDYARMLECGVLHDGEAAELLDGVVVDKKPKSRLHVLVKNLLLDELRRVVPSTMYVASEDPIHVREFRTGRGNVPEPDITVVDGSLKDFVDHPPSERIRLAVEVAASSIESDRQFKQQLFAHGKVAEYWVVDIKQRLVHVFQKPTGVGQEAHYQVVKIVDVYENIHLRLGTKTASISVRAFMGDLPDVR